jgi:hypothetical protein
LDAVEVNSELGQTVPDIPLSAFVEQDLNYNQAAWAYSHMTAYWKAAKNVELELVRDGPILILEDDVSFHRDFKSITSDTVINLSREKPNWGILGLYRFLANGLQETNVKGVLRSSDFLTSHAMIIKDAKTARLMLEGFNQGHPLVPDYSWHHLARGTMAPLEAYVWDGKLIACQTREKFGSDNRKLPDLLPNDLPSILIDEESADDEPEPEPHRPPTRCPIASKKRHRRCCTRCC